MLLEFFLKLIKIACPIALLTLPCVAIMGVTTPWPVAEKALGPAWARNSLLIGTSSESRVYGDQSYERRTQTYIGLPDSRHAFQIVSVTQENGAVRTEVDPYGLLSVLASYAAVAAGTWWFWIRPRNKGPSVRQ